MLSQHAERTAKMTVIPSDCIVPEGTLISKGVTFAPRVVLAGKGIILRENVRLDAACVIGPGVTIGQGAWIRAGAVVLHSVPANAVVEGNPGQIVGYQQGEGESERPYPKHVDINAFSHLPRPSRIDLGVGDSALYVMRRISDARGSLTVGEVPTEIPFSPARYFVVFDVPSMELRGEHAHKQCQQFLVCMHGSCRVLLDDGQSRCEVTLDRPDMGVFMPEMIWGTQYRYSADAVLLVFASRTYEADDYLRNYDDFMTELALRG